MISIFFILSSLYQDDAWSIWFKSNLIIIFLVFFYLAYDITSSFLLYLRLFISFLFLACFLFQAFSYFSRLCLRRVCRSRWVSIFRSFPSKKTQSELILLILLILLIIFILLIIMVVIDILSFTKQLTLSLLHFLPILHAVHSVGLGISAILMFHLNFHSLKQLQYFLHRCHIRLRLIRIQEKPSISCSLVRCHRIILVEGLRPSLDTKL